MEAKEGIVSVAAHRRNAPLLMKPTIAPRMRSVVRVEYRRVRQRGREPFLRSGNIPGYPVDTQYTNSAR
jgi:hypothetical protein